MNEVQRALNMMNAKFIQNNSKIYSNAYGHTYRDMYKFFTYLYLHLWYE